MWTGKASNQARLVSMAISRDFVSAALSGIPMGKWPHDAIGRLVAIEGLALAQSHVVGTPPTARFRKFDDSLASASALDTAVSTFLSGVTHGAFLVDSDLATTVEAQELFEKDDVLLLDKAAGGSLTGAVFRAWFSIG